MKLSQRQTYCRFDRSADAIRFTIEELPETFQRATAMEVDDERFEFAQIPVMATLAAGDELALVRRRKLST